MDLEIVQAGIVTRLLEEIAFQGECYRANPLPCPPNYPMCPGLLEEAATAIDELLEALRIATIGLEQAGFNETAQCARDILAKHGINQ